MRISLNVEGDDVGEKVGVVVLVLTLFSAGQASASGTTRWSDYALRLGLIYPADWHVVVEHDAALKLVATDGAAEFEILPQGASRSRTALASLALSSLAHLHCMTDVKETSASLGKLAISATVARGSCTGGDLGWTVSIAAAVTGTQTILLRSWLLHGQRHDGASLQAILASLAPA